jgi:hypothetical protein
MKLRTRDLILAAAVVACAPLLVRAQAFTARLLGTVADSGGGVLPGATITITNTGNGQEWTAVADGQGQYTVPLLPPGTYRVSAELQGFKRGVREPISLQVNQQQRADFTLDLGSMTEEVVVKGELPMVQTSTATVGIVVTAKETSELPLNGRNFLQLNLLVPGTLPSTKGTTLQTTLPSSAERRRTDQRHHPIGRQRDAWQIFSAGPPRQIQLGLRVNVLRDPLGNKESSAPSPSVTTMTRFGVLR